MGNCLPVSHGFQGLVTLSEPLARRSSYLQGHVCVEGRRGHSSEFADPKLVILFGLVAESARIKPISQAPQLALVNPDPGAGPSKHICPQPASRISASLNF